MTNRTMVIGCLVVGVTVGFWAGRVSAARTPSGPVGLTATEFAIGTLWDLHNGSESKAVQRSLAITLAQMYLDAEGRDEPTRGMIKRMADKVPVLAEELKAIENRNAKTQKRAGQSDEP